MVAKPLCILALAALSPIAAAAEPDWSAPYLGLFVGYVDANEGWDTAAPPGVPEISPEGVILGGLAGYTHGLGPLIVGVEADISVPDLSDEGVCDATPVNCELDVQLLSSLRGRAGIAIGQVQIYGTAGVALGFIQAESANGAGDSKTLSGWTAGAGAEFEARTGLRFGVEYRRTDYGDRSVTFGATGQGEVALATDDVRLKLSIALD